MTVQAKILSFSFPTSTGSFAVAGVGFQPQFVRFWYNGIAGTGTATGTAAGNGMMHAGGQGATYVINDANGAEGRQRVTSGDCITVVSSGGSVVATADYVSMDSDGFTITVGTAPAASFTVDVLCLAGPDLVVQSGLITSNSSPITVSLTAEPDLLWLWGNAQSNFTNNQGSHYEALAVATNDVLTTGGVRRRGADGSGAGSGLSTARVWQATVSNESEWDLTALSTSAFTLTRASGSGGIYAIWVALSGIDAAIGTLTQPSSAGAQTITAGIAPAAVVLLGGDTASDGTYDTTTAEYVRGASDGTAQFAHWYGIIAGSSPAPEGGRARSTTRLLTSCTQGTPTFDADAAIDALLRDGFRIDWVNADATARVVGWLALGNPGVTPVSVPDTAAGSDLISGVTTGTLADVVSASDAANAAAAATLSDSAGGADTAAGARAATLLDTGLASTAVSVAVSGGLSDAAGSDETVTGAGAASVAAGAVGSDTISGVRTALIPDSATGIDTVSAGGSGTATVGEGGAGSDLVTAQAAAALADSATAIEAVGAVSGALVPDSADATSTLSARRIAVLTDSATVNDAVSVVPVAGLSDSASGTTFITAMLQVPIADSAGAVDTIGAPVLQSPAGVLVTAHGYRATVSARGYRARFIARAYQARFSKGAA